MTGARADRDATVAQTVENPAAIRLYNAALALC